MTFFVSYAVPVLIALLIGAMYPAARAIRSPLHRYQYHVLQGITFACAIVGAKLAYLFGDLGGSWWSMPPGDYLLRGGRSLTGALLGGFVGAEIAKWWIRYPLPPNDRFAMVLPLTIAVGRIGCHLTGCCRGLPWSGWCAVRYADDAIWRHPAALYELTFHALFGLSAILCVRKGWFRGEVFAIYLMSYGMFRLITETIRDTPKPLGGWSTYQILAMLMVIAGGTFFIKRRFWPPVTWRSADPSTDPEIRHA